MKKLHINKIIRPLIVLLVITFFGILYWTTIMNLPLFGDATIHGLYADKLLKTSWNQVYTDYPPFYYYLMNTNFVFFGEKGYNLIPFLGVILILFSTFILINQFTRNFYISLFSVILVACSPKIVFYSARMYQEILITGMFIFCFYLFFKYLDTYRKILIYLLAFFVGITLSIKQQGLFILYPSFIIFFLIDTIRKRKSLENLTIVFFVPIFVGFSFYGVLFHTKGVIQPGSEEFDILRMVNSVGKGIFMYQERPEEIESLNDRIVAGYTQINLSEKDINDARKLNIKLEEIDKKYFEQSHQRAESLHIYPQDVFLNFDKFNRVSSLFLDWYNYTLKHKFLIYFTLITTSLGLLYCLKNRKKYSNLLIYTCVFIILNLALFARNTDQPRYHLFISIYLLIFTSILIQHIFMHIKFNLMVKPLLIIATISIFLPVLFTNLRNNQSWDNSQIYTPSRGGIYSIQESGKWLSTNKNAFIVGQQCGNELAYYTKKPVMGDWRIYFMDTENLEKYFLLYNISHYVVYESQIHDDKDWSHICWVPRSFYTKLENNFKRVYTSTSKDIYIYDTTRISKK